MYVYVLEQLTTAEQADHDHAITCQQIRQPHPVVRALVGRCGSGVAARDYHVEQTCTGCEYRSRGLGPGSNLATRDRPVPVARVLRVLTGFMLIDVLIWRS